MTASSDIKVKQAQPKAIIHWLSAGWHDLRLAGTPSLLHGLIISIISIAITTLTFVYWQLLPGAVTGFIIIGPFLATGLYALSCRIEKNYKPTMKDAMNAWRHGSRCLLMFGVLLVLAASAWVAFSVAMFHFFIDVQIHAPLDFLRHVVSQDDVTFMMWAILGGIGSALAFAITVCAVPLLVERDITTADAIYASIRAVSENPVTMGLWAMTILSIVGFSFITLMLGFIILYPLLGHASWHAYRDLIDADALKLRCEFSSDG